MIGMGSEDGLCERTEELKRVMWRTTPVPNSPGCISVLHVSLLRSQRREGTPLNALHLVHSPSYTVEWGHLNEDVELERGDVCQLGCGECFDDARQ